MEHDGHEASDQGELGVGERLRQVAAVVGEKARGAGLRRLQSDRPHLGEHAARRQLNAPAGDLANAPRDRSAGEPRDGRGAVLRRGRRAFGHPVDVASVVGALYR